MCGLSFALALGFATPWLLAGLGVATVPILIHFLFRRPQREIRWAATRFLLRAIERQSKRLRTEQFLLLAIRTLLLLLVTVAMSRPFLSTAAPVALGPTPPIHRILIVDGSYSMGYRVEGGTRFTRVQQAARDILSASRAGDAFHLLQITSLEPRTVIGRPAYQAASVVDAIDDLQPTAGRADLIATLREVPALLQQLPRMTRKEVIIFSDFQQIDWMPAGEAATALRNVLSQITDRAAVQLFDASRDGMGGSDLLEQSAAEAGSFPNTVVLDLATDLEFVKAGQPARIVATLQQFGPSPRRTERVELLVDGVSSGIESVALRQNEQATVAFAPTFPSEGAHFVEVRLVGDALPIDDRRGLAVTARNQIRVLLVNGGAERGEAASTYYIEHALAPQLTNPQQATNPQRASKPQRLEPTQDAVTDFLPTVVDEGEFTRTHWPDYDVICLCNVALLSDWELQNLHAFVVAGGGVVIALGDQTRLPAWQAAFADPATALMGLSLGERIGDPREPKAAVSFDTSDLTHAIVRPFAGNPGTGLDSDFVLAYANIDLLAPANSESAGTSRSRPLASGDADRPTFVRSPTIAALRYTNGDPAIATNALGRGRVVLLTTSVDSSWSGPWPQLGRSYLPLVHQITRYAALGQPAGQFMFVGAPLVWQSTLRLATPDVNLTLPDGSVQHVTVPGSADGTQILFERTYQPGPYRLESDGSGNNTALWAANVDASEGDLTPLTAEQRQGLLPTARSVTADRPISMQTPLADSPLSRWLLAAALGLTIVEPVLAWRQPCGLAVLFVVILTFVAAGLWQFDYRAGLAGPAVGLAGFAVWAAFSWRRTQRETPAAQGRSRSALRK